MLFRSDHINERLQDIENDIEANPFMNILSSPIRKCQISDIHAPKGMMAQLKAVYLPPGNEAFQEKPSDSKEDEDDPASQENWTDSMRWDPCKSPGLHSRQTQGSSDSMGADVNNK